MTEVVVTTGAVRRAKLQSNGHQQQTNTQFCYRPMPFLSPNQQHQSTGGIFRRIANLHNICGSFVAKSVNIVIGENIFR